MTEPRPAVRMSVPAPVERGVTAALVGMDGFHLAHRALLELGLVEVKGAPQTFDADGYLALLRRLRDPGERVVWAPEFHREIEDSVGSAIGGRARARCSTKSGTSTSRPGSDTSGWLPATNATVDRPNRPGTAPSAPMNAKRERSPGRARSPTWWWPSPGEPTGEPARRAPDPGGLPGSLTPRTRVRGW